MELLIEFMNKNWPGRWTKEAVDYFNNGGTGSEYLLCVLDNKVIAFAKVCYPYPLEVFALTQLIFVCLYLILPVSFFLNLELRFQ